MRKISCYLFQDEMALIREAENEYNEQVSNHCFHLFEKISLDNMGVEVTPQLKKVSKCVLFFLIKAHLNAIVGAF